MSKVIETADEVVRAASIGRAKLKVFLSYARADMAFADRLVELLEALGIECLIDRRDLPYGEEWKRELNEFIHAADAVVFVISPRSIASRWCQWEIGEIQQHSKRLVPVVLEAVPIDKLPQMIGDRQIMPFEDVWDNAAAVGMPGLAPRVEKLASTLLTDWSWLKEHTRIGQMARRWQLRGRPDALLMRGNDLDEAETWAAHRPRLSPHLSDLIRTFLAASRRGEADRLQHEREQVEQITRQQAEIEREQDATRRQQAQTRMAQRRARRFLYLVAVLVVASLATAVLESYRTSVREAEVFASAAEIAFERSYCDRALRLALAGLPNEGALPWAYTSPLLQGQLARFAAVCPLSQVLEGHAGAVHDAAFDRAGQRIVTASWDGTARLWNAQTGETMRVFGGSGGDGHAAAVESVSWSPDESQIVTASWDATARIWDVATGKSIAVFRGHASKLETAAFSPDGSRLLTASHDGTARLWDVATTQEVGRCIGHTNMLHAARFSPDGGLVVTASWDTTARLWKVDETGRCTQLRILHANDEEGTHESAVFDAVFSPDGTRILTGSEDKTARVWEAASGRRLLVLSGHEKGVHGVGFDPTGELIATASSDWTVRLSDARSGRLVRSMNGHVHTAHSARFSADGRFVLSSSQDGTARLWDWHKGEPQAVFKGGQHEHLRKARLSPDGALVATVTADGRAQLYEAATGAALGQLPQVRSELTDVQFAPDGSRLAMAAIDGTVRTVDAVTRRVLHTMAVGAPVDVVAFSPDANVLATLQLEGHLRLWSPASGGPIPLPQDVADRTFASIRFGRDSTRALAAGMDGEAVLWEIASARILARMKANDTPLWSAEFDPGETAVLTASRDRTARIWTLATGAQRVVTSDHLEAVRTADFDADGTKVVTASWDRTARIVRLNRQSTALELRGHQDTLSGANFSPKTGRYALTRSEDKTARLWDAETGAEVRRFNGFVDAIVTAEFSKAGDHILIAARDDEARYWALDPVVGVAPQQRRDWICRNVLRSPAAQAFRAAEMKDQLLQGRSHLVNPCRRAARIETLRRWFAERWADAGRSVR